MTNERIGLTWYGGQPGDLSRLGRLALLVPEAPLLLLLGGGSLALGGSPLLGALAPVLALSFSVRAVALFLARWLLLAARYRDADALARVALAIHPWSADALALRGVLALASGEPAEAERQLRRSARLLPGRAAVYAALSGALLELGRPTEAAAAARQALELNGGCAAAYLHLAEAEQHGGALPSAVEDWLRAGLAAAPDPETETTLRCALAWHLVGQGRGAEARLATAGVEATLPRCTKAHQSHLRVRLCELLVAQGQTERARELLRGAAG
ncbi:MAG TPA: tetratricopeptide repeat protein [Roseiflexaceae bacterium]|nr:tetratricopeptide repeat protein [Roseiflexaceae bacterium]